MIYVINHIPIKTPNRRRANIKMKPEFITIHNTGNVSSTAQNERAWLTNPINTRQASYHIVVDHKEAIECIPIDEVAWHAGDGSGKGNRASIGVEICESGDYKKNVENAIEIVVKLMQEYNFTINQVKRHFDWSGKICPRLMYDQGSWIPWNLFLNRIQARLSEMQKIDVLEQQIEKLTKELEAIQSKSAMNPPEWSKAAVESAVKSGLINTPNGGSFDFYRIITILHRKGLL